MVFRLTDLTTLSRKKRSVNVFCFESMSLYRVGLSLSDLLCSSHSIVQLAMSGTLFFKNFLLDTCQPYSNFAEAYVYTFPEIHLWYDTSAGVYGQHSSQSLSPHACFSRGRMLDLNHRPPTWQVDMLTTQPQ